ncbi:MAG: hypothetical protein JWL81_362 [Verrucomicrobiales bacterium]|nr:hypothetical protein [Verrucomicrobiales bacterium]
MPDMAHPNEFTVQCPGCEAGYQVPSSMAGTVVTCKSCQTEFQIAEQPESTPPLTLPSPAPRPPSSPMMEGPDFQYEVPARKSRGSGFVKSVLLIGSGAALVVALSNFQQQKHKKSGPVKTPAPSSSSRASTAAAPEPPAPETASAFPSIDNRERAPAENAVSVPSTVAADPAMASKLSLSGPDDSGNAVVPDQAPPAILPPPDMKAPLPAGPGQVAVAPTTSPTAVPPNGPAAPAAPAAPIRNVDSKVLRQNSRTSLERFLLAPDLATRLSVSQHPEKVKAEMEAYYQKTPAGPLPLEEMTFLAESTLPESSFKFHLYNVSLKGQEAAIPFAVEESADGFRVDWQTFVESYDHKLREFFATPTETPGKFRVLLRRAHYFGPAVPGQDTVRVAYSVEPPTRDETFYAWADLESLVYRQKLATGERAGWEAQSYVIVELAWRGNPESGRWVAVQRIVSDSWRED